MTSSSSAVGGKGQGQTPDTLTPIAGGFWVRFGDDRERIASFETKPSLRVQKCVYIAGDLSEGTHEKITASDLESGRIMAGMHASSLFVK
jgi:hypothetical protein